MAATRKSTKRTAAKKRSSAKRSSTKKRPKSKAPKTTALQRQARKGLRAAKDGIETVRQAGEKTWETLKATTAQVVEGVRDRI
jgi:hypothetical protein